MGSRADGSNPRAAGSNPRAKGTNPRSRRTVELTVDGGEVRAADGSVVGRLVSLRVELLEDALPRAGARERAHDPAVELPIESNELTLLKGSQPAAAPRAGARVSAREGDPSANAPREVWDHYAEVMKPRSRTLPDAERKVIRDALKVATVAECKRAIDGCAASSFHMGSNDRHRKYNKLSQILKGRAGKETTRERIDFFLEIADKSGVQSGFTSADPHRVAAAKRDVLDAFEFPGDEHAVQRGEMSAEWLAQHGWRVQRQGDGRPEFVRVES